MATGQHNESSPGLPKTCFMAFKGMTKRRGVGSVMQRIDKELKGRVHNAMKEVATRCEPSKDLAVAPVWN